MCAIQPSRDSETHNCFTWITDELLHRWRSGFKLDVMVVIHQSQCGDPLNLTLYFSLNGDNNAQNLHHRLIVCVCAFYVLTAHVRCCSNEAGTTGYNIRISTAVPDLKNIIILFFRREKRFCEVFFLDKAEQLFHSYPFKESEAVNYLLQFWCCIWVNAHLPPAPHCTVSICGVSAWTLFVDFIPFPELLGDLKLCCDLASRKLI